jgi:hypothetical protein
MTNLFFKNTNFGRKSHFLIAKFSSNLSKFSSISDDSIQNLDKSAALFILSLVPHAR